MIGEHAFCPTSGASLSREYHYDEHGRPERVPQHDNLTTNDTSKTPLTTGARRSSKRALATYFRRCHRRHAEQDDDLYRRASLALMRLKRTANGREEVDEIIWYTLSERLDRKNVDVEWMSTHVEPRCPECSGRLSYVSGPDGPIGRCGTSCSGDRHDRLSTIRKSIVSLYNRAFPNDPSLDIDDLTLL